MIELLHTKLFIPRPRKNLVARPCIPDRLSAVYVKRDFLKSENYANWVPWPLRVKTDGEYCRASDHFAVSGGK